MKTMAFLLTLISLVAHDITADTPAVDLSDVTVEIHRGGERNTMTIRMRGETSIDIDVQSSTVSYAEAILATDGEHIVVAGYGIVVDDASRRYVAYVHAYDTAGNLVYTYVTEENHQEVRAIHTVNGVLVFQIDEHEEDEEGRIHQVSTHFITIDFFTSNEHRISFDEPLPHVTECEGFLCLHRHDTHPPRYAIDEELNVLDDESVYGIAANQTTTDAVEGFILNPGTLNDEAVHGRFTVRFPGHYTLFYAGREVSFTIEPIVEGITHGDVVMPGLIVTVNKGYLRLNGQPFTSGEPIDEPGHHQLTIEGLGGYVKTLDFTVTADLDGVYDGNRYDAPRTLRFKGVGFLNGRLIESGTVVDEAGQYTLEIFGVNEYKETHVFEIAQGDKGAQRGAVIIEVGLFAVGTTLVVGGVWWSWRKKGA